MLRGVGEGEILKVGEGVGLKVGEGVCLKVGECDGLKVGEGVGLRVGGGVGWRDGAGELLPPVGGREGFMVGNKRAGSTLDVGDAVVTGKVRGGVPSKFASSVVGARVEVLSTSSDKNTTATTSMAITTPTRIMSTRPNLLGDKPNSLLLRLSWVLGKVFDSSAGKVCSTANGSSVCRYVGRGPLSLMYILP